MRKLLASLLLFGSLILSSTAEAQELELYSADDFFAEIYPEIPGANERVDLELDSYSFNVNNLYIIWFKNGEKQSSGYGNDKYNFTTGKTGETIVISVSIEANNTVYRKEFRFTPSEVDLLWEAIDAYTPPFYRGKPVFAKQGKVRITAIPETQLIAPTDAPNLVYYWERNKKKDPANSGFGKHFYEFEGEALLSSDEIKLTTNDRRENSYAQQRIELIPSNDIDILFYEINPEGRLLTQRALNNISRIDGSQVHTSFHPLSMSSTETNFTDLFVGWKVNNEERAPQDFAQQNEIAISSNNAAGQIQLGIELDSIKKILQSAKENITLTFTGK